MANAAEEIPRIIITIRLIRSFEYRSIKNIVLKIIPSLLTVRELVEEIGREIARSTALPPPFKKYDYDTLKIFTFAHGQKPNSTAINLEDDEKYILSNLDAKLVEYGITNETEISFFNKLGYEKFKDNPVEQAWN